MSSVLLPFFVAAPGRQEKIAELRVEGGHVVNSVVQFMNAPALFVAIGLQAWAPQLTRAATAPLQQQSTLHLGGSDRPCLGLRGGQGNSVGASASSGSEARQQALDAVKAAEAELKALTAAEKEERERAAVLEEQSLDRSR